MSKITTLIDKEDSVEIVRNQIAAILVAERDNQKTLATAAGKDPALWDFNVYIERADPWSIYQNSETEVTPIVNVWIDNETFEGGASNIAERQTANGRFNIDIYARGLAKDDGNGGHTPGDLDAALNMHRTIRLVRNILMAATYSYLDLRGLVGKRWPESISTFQPQQDNQQAQAVVAARMPMSVRYNEFSPQVEGDTLEQIAASITLDPSGEVIQATFDYT